MEYKCNSIKQVEKRFYLSIPYNNLLISETCKLVVGATATNCPDDLELVEHADRVIFKSIEVEVNGELLCDKTYILTTEYIRRDQQTCLDRIEYDLVNSVITPRRERVYNNKEFILTRPLSDLPLLDNEFVPCGVTVGVYVKTIPDYRMLFISNNPKASPVVTINYVRVEYRIIPKCLVEIVTSGGYTEYYSKICRKESSHSKKDFVKDEIVSYTYNGLERIKRSTSDNAFVAFGALHQSNDDPLRYVQYGMCYKADKESYLYPLRDGILAQRYDNHMTKTEVQPKERRYIDVVTMNVKDTVHIIATGINPKDTTVAIIKTKEIGGVSSKPDTNDDLSSSTDSDCTSTTTTTLGSSTDTDSDCTTTTTLGSDRTSTSSTDTAISSTNTSTSSTDTAMSSTDTAMSGISSTDTAMSSTDTAMSGISSTDTDTDTSTVSADTSTIDADVSTIDADTSTVSADVSTIDADVSASSVDAIIDNTNALILNKHVSESDNDADDEHHDTDTESVKMEVDKQTPVEDLQPIRCIVTTVLSDIEETTDSALSYDEIERLNELRELDAEIVEKNLLVHKRCIDVDYYHTKGYVFKTRFNRAIKLGDVICEQPNFKSGDIFMLGGPSLISISFYPYIDPAEPCKIANRFMKYMDFVEAIRIKYKKVSYSKLYINARDLLYATPCVADSGYTYMENDGLSSKKWFKKLNGVSTNINTYMLDKGTKAVYERMTGNNSKHIYNIEIIYKRGAPRHSVVLYAEIEKTISVHNWKNPHDESVSIL